MPEGQDTLPWLAHNDDLRLSELIGALTSENTEVILSGRGGYGVSDLLHQLP